VTVRPGDGVGGTDRVMIVWSDGAIVNSWLRVTVLANSHTALAAPDVHYWGNAIGESGNVTGDARVDFADRLAIFQNLSAGPVPSTNRFDINRDRVVDATDGAIVDAHLTGLTADLNRDDIVGVADLAAIQTRFGAASPGPYDGDLNGDGAVNRTDVALFALAFGTIASPAMLSSRLPLISLAAPSPSPSIAVAEAPLALRRTESAGVSMIRGFDENERGASILRARARSTSSEHEVRVANSAELPAVLHAVRSLKRTRILSAVAVDFAIGDKSWCD
jgi:hypothetical protein